jgi:hypothetical protein
MFISPGGFRRWILARLVAQAGPHVSVLQRGHPSAPDERPLRPYFGTLLGVEKSTGWRRSRTIHGALHLVAGTPPIAITNSLLECALATRGSIPIVRPCRLAFEQEMLGASTAPALRMRDPRRRLAPPALRTSDFREVVGDDVR